MTPHVDYCDEEELSTSEDDDGLKDDMDAVQACKIDGKNLKLPTNQNQQMNKSGNQRYHIQELI